MNKKKQTIVIALAMMLISSSAIQTSAAGDDRVLTVMTRNLDTGTDFGPIFSATTPFQLLTAVGAAYAEVQTSNIPERAAGVAKEIEANQPDLVALQEVTTVYIGPYGGPATTLVADQLQSLLDELASRGLHYAPIAVLTNLDAEAPALDSSFNIFDVRTTDHDVILARTDLPVSEFKLENTQTHHFATNLTFFNPLLGSLTTPHGWISVDAKLRGKNYRFVTTHLEVLSPAIQAAQATELVQQAANTDLPVVFAGDFNADAESSDSGANPAYNIMMTAGFVDTWRQVHPADQGFTWPLHGEDPFIPFTTPYQRIDLVFSRGGLKGIDPVNIALIGNNQSTALTPSGLWPSDHAGLAASFTLKP